MEGNVSKIRTMAGDLERARVGAARITASGQETAGKGAALPQVSATSERPKQFQQSSAPRSILSSEERQPPPLVRPTEEVRRAGAAPPLPPPIRPREPASSAGRPASPASGITVEKPVAPPIAEKEERKLSEILAEARRRLETGPRSEESISPAKTTSREAPAARKTLEDILPIEERPATADKPALVSPPASLPTGQAGTFASRDRDVESRNTPPLNLPTEEFLRRVSETAAAGGPARSARFVGPETAKPAGDLKVQVPGKEIAKISPRETPEEMLGLPARPAGGPMRQVSVPAGQAGLRGEPIAPIRGVPSSRMTAPPPVREKEEAIFTVGAPKYKTITSFKFALITGILSITLIAIVGGAYFKFFVEKPSAPPPPPPQSVIEQPMPRPFVSYDDRKILEVSELAYGPVKTKIDSLGDMEFPVGTLSYTPIRFRTDKEIRYVTLDELFQILKIDAPPQIRNAKAYNLFAYSQSPSAKTECFAAGITDPLCYGRRLGLMIPLSQFEASTTVSAVVVSMQEWEKTMTDDLRPLLLALPQETQETRFKNGKYKDFETRFINLPISTTSFDWILTDEYLIIATSKDAARVALDRTLKNETAK